MTEIPRKLAADDVLKTFKVDGFSLYIIGTFDTGVTVFSQQIRALNLAWASIESTLIPTTSIDINGSTIKKQKIAIIGTGFAGLSIAAGLLAKDANAEVTLFEQRDTLLPFQQGSDSRWLHPRIYDWPRVGSEVSVAMIPLLNWSAARASDVAVQVLSKWRRVVKSLGATKVRLFCNTRHLQIHNTASNKNMLHIEWMGEGRDPCDGTAQVDIPNVATGMSEDFNHVILAIGFGPEKDGVLSYWRNETIGQPSLDEPRRTYLLSGQGDGAMIDLLRIRISQYRQDRILDEVFSTLKTLLASVRELYEKYSSTPQKSGLFNDFEGLATADSTSLEFKSAVDAFRRRLRRDTDAILRLKVKKLSELFEPSTSRISFQNKLLVYFLYKCGGFVPSTQDETKIVKQYGIPKERIIRRHGTLRYLQLEDMLSEDLFKAIKPRSNIPLLDTFSQTDKPMWPGGYFDFPGPSESAKLVTDSQRGHWRKEYLPGPTELLATALCSTLAGALVMSHTMKGRLRVTLHRSMVFGSDELLQQACDYQGTDDARSQQSAAGRTFPNQNGTIGQAYRCQRIVRSIENVNSVDLNKTMESLRLHEASRKMSTQVGFVLAIPLLEGNSTHAQTSSSQVLGVIYIDSTAAGFFIDDEKLKQLVQMAQSFLSALLRASLSSIDRVRNIPLVSRVDVKQHVEIFDKNVEGLLELVNNVRPPKLDTALQFNFDFSDLQSYHT